MLEKVALFAADACAALFLSGCGDGMPAEEPHAIDRIGKSANTLLVSDLLLSIDFSEILFQSDCAGTACEMSAPGLETVIISLADLVDGAAGEWPSAAETHRNVSLAREVGIGATDSLIGAGDAYAGWLDHNFFLVGHVSLTDADLWTFRFPMGISVGRATGSNPVRGSATWSGVMVGVDTNASRFSSVRGDADLVIGGFANPKLTVMFTNIRDVDIGRPREAMMWHDVPMTSGGFATGSDGNSIQGKFYGPDHGEAGGIFERDRVIGAFGAKRR
ncbi:MAG: transferrin-binding protein-like solute binding protein [Boseongicola sp. SB0677_bin_26]|nr:transferrin-binding protein-like solute binding protein [Boseongicola sp. SB0677_bin_26]